MADHAVEYGLLGPFEARGPGGLLRLGAPKSRALLALLALNANRVVARERLIDSLWGEEPPGTAVKAIQVYVSQLRKVLPAGRLQSHSRGYLLRAEPALVDVMRFEQLVEEAHDAAPALSSALLASALQLWRGPPLAEFASEPFAQLESRASPTSGSLPSRSESRPTSRWDATMADRRARAARGRAPAPRAASRAAHARALPRGGQVDALAAYRDAQAALSSSGSSRAVAAPARAPVLTQDPVLDLRRSGRSRRVGDQVHLPGALIPASPFPFVGRSRRAGGARAARAR